jgi:uncharacterized membrane protein YqhA
MDRGTALLARAFLGATRLAMLVAIATLVAAATVLVVLGAASTARLLATMVGPQSVETSSRELFLLSVKLLDRVLLATVLAVVAIGLFSLFIDERIPAPQWLHKADVDSLKNKLAGIIAVMLGVLFLEKLIPGGGTPELLPTGIAIAAVILALSYFIRSHPGGGGGP